MISKNVKQQQHDEQTRYAPVLRSSTRRVTLGPLVPI